MKKEEVARVLKEMADVLEVVESNTFEIAAYRKAAQALDDWDGDLGKTVSDRDVGTIPSVGKGIGQVISDLVQSGHSEECVRIRGLVPEGLPELLKVRGLGPKRVRALWQNLDVDSVAKLKEAAVSGAIAELKGFGAKTVERIVSSLEYLDRPIPLTAEREVKDIAMPVARTSTGRISAGMSGYSYAEWKGSFYPDEAKTKDLLELYATKLATVEINNTFHRFPTEKVLQQWDERTPEGFQFSLKAHSRITHKLRLQPDTVRTILDFAERCALLQAKLGCILFQLPPDFQRDDERLARLLDSLPQPARYAIEFRHPSWFDKSVLGRLSDANVAVVCGESKGRDDVRVVTADFVYARLRRESYSSSELDAWQAWFHEQSVAGRDVYAYFKHDATGHAPNEVTNRWGGSGRKIAASAARRTRAKKDAG